MSTRPRRIDLYELLPAVYQLRDAEQGLALQALVDIVSEQAEAIQEDIGRLWDDFFVETCADWVLPYIGDLVGSTPLHDVSDTRAAPDERGGLRRRADVAKTIYYRRRKGTLPMLEEVTRDVTRWGARAVAFFDLIEWSQHLEHQRGVLAGPPWPTDTVRAAAVGTRYLRPATADVRDLDVLQRVNGPFDDLAHTADIRPGGRGRGWHHPRRIGFFLWRLRTNRTIDPVDARPADGGPGFHLSPLGHPTPLFNEPRPDIDPAERGDERSVPAPLRHLAIARAPSAWYGDVVRVWRRVGATWQVVAVTDLVLMDLSNWAEPPAGKMGLDVDLGRVRWPGATQPTAVRSAFTWAFSAAMGGGPYDRRLPVEEAGDEDRADTVRDPDALDVHLRVPDTHPTLAAAVASLAAGSRAVIELLGDATYSESPTLNLTASEVVIQAENNRRPVLFGDITVTGGGAEARLAIDGLTIAGSLRVNAWLRELDLRHSTLVPGRRPGDDGEPVAPDTPSVEVRSGGRVDSLTVDACITGALRMPAEPGRIEARDSILQSTGTSGPAHVTPAAVSGSLSPFPAITAPSPQMRVTIGRYGPRVVALGSAPTSLTDARDRLELALHAADTSPAFAGARVYVGGTNVLIVIPGEPGDVIFENDGADHSADELRLVSSGATALVGGPLPATVDLTAPSPEVAVTWPGSPPSPLALGTAPMTRAQLRTDLNSALGSGRFAVLHGDSLAVVVPGRPGLAFSATASDKTTVRELGLASRRPVLAGSDDGDMPGPPTSLERCTVLGPVYARELDLVSETILAEPAQALRRQQGCVRLSSVAPGSRVPRRFRCQPDLAFEVARRERGEDTLDPAVSAPIEQRLAPHFTSTRYGDPGYCQLAGTCARELREGAEDGAELGAFKRLQQPQREANLALRLEEYLPVGLDPVLIHMT
jgi:hypothetical protein